MAANQLSAGLDRDAALGTDASAPNGTTTTPCGGTEVVVRAKIQSS
jgi:hypothetical protein